jgi:hypothetical protein
MKKIVLGIQFGILSTFMCVSQDFNYPVGQHLIKDIITDDFQSFYIDIMTPESQDITYHWEVVSNTFPESWIANLCDYGGCAAGVPENGQMYPISESEMNEGTHGFFKLNMICGFNYGQGKLEVYVYDSNNYAIGDTVSWDLTWEQSDASLINNNESTTRIETHYKENEMIFTSNSNAFQSIQIYATSGELIYTNTMLSTMISIDTYDIPEGIYFVHGKFENGELFTQKIVL